ncbi:hypothetical protein NW765_010525 [Fusarium oxysporum]|uniref:Uncharacterized protein n=2 Tax=Fusarium oxysporum TaxID=5507 RepID=A0A2H3GCY0_FUSOX|nr:hypothetical protein FOWG_04271 [Fusarium oxysporum f. sp. lycopersici MN25]KAJ4117112.1 hypothetical protein NW765_010525 [Fusarium oxysporum]PCD28717.1 hypothetical protein AU210_011275 [Fusarium oxysporum f. sp. radicis-cucumerinum]KAJ4273198.1 hypothetical protein NW764_012445 [Fusarium oxysporum]RKL03975.1 hypothetical protein BFJ71_g3944 [Fusarium oxysporum]
MPKPSETSVFTRTDNTAGNQEKIEKLASQWKGKGIEITVGPERITFITPPGLQSRGEDSVKNLRAQMEKDGLWEDWKVETLLVVKNLSCSEGQVSRH